MNLIQLFSSLDVTVNRYKDLLKMIIYSEQRDIAIAFKFNLSAFSKVEKIE